MAHNNEQNPKHKYLFRYGQMENRRIHVVQSRLPIIVHSISIFIILHLFRNKLIDEQFKEKLIPFCQISMVKCSQTTIADFN